MKQYRKNIMAIIEENRETLEKKMREIVESDEKWCDGNPELSMLDLSINEFRLHTLFPLLTPSLRQQWYTHHCTIDTTLTIHGDDDDFIPSVIDELPILEMPCAKFENNSNWSDICDNEGLYFLGMVGINPLTEQTYYLVKIGVSDDCEKRVNQYASYNPMLFCSKCI